VSRLLRFWMFRLMERYDNLPADDCLADLQSKRIIDMEPEWQVAYLEYTLLLDSSKHYQTSERRGLFD